MIDATVYKKMIKANKFGMVGICECGKEHKFKSSDIDLKESHGSVVSFKNTFECPSCKTHYNGIIENQKNRNSWYRNLSPIGVIVSFILVFGIGYGGYKFLGLFSSDSPSSTYYDTGDPSDMTNKELDDFIEWKLNEKEKQLNNSPAFND